ncbi:hypothetical protein Shyhy01_20280 [Streptomyces hygroscopicus subsp. hygroscopicus]|nr:hypothetical protein Shyhy01_20280 [Streptomyces hygroscopicus subsp. hygroscopicus]
MERLLRGEEVRGLAAAQPTEAGKGNPAGGHVPFARDRRAGEASAGRRRAPSASAVFAPVASADGTVTVPGPTGWSG